MQEKLEKEELTLKVIYLQKDSLELLFWYAHQYFSKNLESKCTFSLTSAQILAKNFMTWAQISDDDIVTEIVIDILYSICLST